LERERNSGAIYSGLQAETEIPSHARAFEEGWTLVTGKTRSKKGGTPVKETRNWFKSRTTKPSHVGKGNHFSPISVNDHSEDRSENGGGIL
jgi:hypothetical protein